MSLKQLRKFKNQTSAAKVTSLINEVELSEEEEVIVNKRVNLFDMLDTGDPEIAQSQSESEEQTPIVHIVAIKSKSKKKKKKKAKLLKQKLEKSESDFEAEPQPIVQEEEVEEVLDSNDDPLFRLDYRNFDREFELQKSFGKSVVSGKKVKTKTMIQVSKSWPRFHSGLTLVAIEGTNGFKLEYSKSYAIEEERFIRAVESNDPSRIMDILGTNPFHLNTLLQWCDIYKNQNITESAEDFLHRALYVFETLLPRDSVILKHKSISLPYTYIENRAIHIAFFKQVQFLHKQGYWRTALEFNKYLYSLDHSDPLASILYLDILAFRSEEYKWFIDFYLNNPSLHIIPGLNFTYALTLHSLKTPTATEVLQNNIRKYPFLIKKLFEKLEIKNKTVEENLDWFDTPSWTNGYSPDVILLLSEIYTSQSFLVWKIPSNLKFLVDGLEGMDGFVDLDMDDEFIEVEQRFYRFCVLGEESWSKFLPEGAFDGLVIYDPFPPKRVEQIHGDGESGVFGKMVDYLFQRN